MTNRARCIHKDRILTKKTKVKTSRNEPSDEGYKSFVDLNFKVTAAYHKRFRREAAGRSLSLKALLEASFLCFLEKNGGTLEKMRDDL